MQIPKNSIFHSCQTIYKRMYKYKLAIPTKIIARYVSIFFKGDMIKLNIKIAHGSGK
jgi:hypothetical protein